MYKNKEVMEHGKTQILKKKIKWNYNNVAIDFSFFNKKDMRKWE